MQFSFTGPSALKKMLDEAKTPPLSRSQFILLLVLEGVKRVNKARGKKKV